MGEQQPSGSCRRVFAAFFAIAAFFILVVAIAMLNVRLTLLSPSFIKRIPVRQGIYSQLPQIALNILLDDEIEFGPNAVDLETAIGRDPLENLVEALIPPSWLQEQVDQRVDAFFDWLVGNGDFPDLSLDYWQLRQGAASDEVRDALRDLFAALPPCTADNDFFAGDFPICRPPASELELFINEAIIGLQDVFSPDSSFTEGTEVGLGELTDQIFLSVQEMYRYFIWGLIGSWLAFLILITLTIGIGARGLDEILLWLGVPVLLAGGVVWLGSALVYAETPKLIMELFAQSQAIPPNTELLATFVENFLTESSRDVLGRWLIMDFFIVMAGMGSLFAGYVLRRLKPT